MVLEEGEKIEDLGIDGLKIVQSDKLYKFTSDSVLLSKFASHKKNDRVADFCAGCGIVGMHYYALNQSTESVTFFEVQSELSELNKKAIEINCLQDKMTAVNCRVQDIGSDYNGKFTLVLCNPPYKKKNSGEKCQEGHIAVCKHEIMITQEEIIATASKKLCHGGRLCMCQRTERFIEAICTMKENGLNPVKIQFVSSGKDENIYLFLIEAVKNVSPQIKILPTLKN